MGGYNTIAEAVSQGIPTVCVPRTTPRSEQLLRAQAFERLGLLSTIHPKELDPEVLRDAIKVSLSTNRQALRERAGSLLTFDGAQRAAISLFNLAAIRSPQAKADWAGNSVERLYFMPGN
jgi:predicted glycosyltransferase